MGGGPHPGYLSSLYMTGVTMLSMLDVAEAAVEDDDQATLSDLLDSLRRLDKQFVRDDREFLPSSHGASKSEWGEGDRQMWAMMALRIYPQIARLQGVSTELVVSGLRRAMRTATVPIEEWGVSGRGVVYYSNGLYADAMILGASLNDGGIELSPLPDPSCWPAEQTVETPFGDLKVRAEREQDAVVLRLEAGRDYPVTVRYCEQVIQTSSTGCCTLRRKAGENEAGEETGE